MSIILQKNQAIQFRAPNLATELTYPAYENYYIKLNEAPADNAIPATFQPAKDFFEANNYEYCNLAANKIYQIDHNKVIEHTDITTNNAFNELKNNHTWVFKNTSTGGNYDFVYVNARVTSISTYYTLDFIESNWGAFSAWLQTVDVWPNTVNSPKYSGFFRKLPANNSRKPGYLVDASYYKYSDATIFYSLDSLYVQRPDTTTTPKKDGLGISSTDTVGLKDVDYTLQSGEYLLINYTNSTTDTSGSSTKSIVNKIYTAGTIIRPNFNIIDSSLNTATPSKKSGFSFPGYPNVRGMYALGADQQIELRKYVRIKLSNSITNIYWVRNDEELLNTDGIITFAFDEDNKTAYTLKEGEYFFYTDANKDSLAYYGEGTKIVRTGAIELTKSAEQDKSITTESILSDGLVSAIPWKTYSFNESNKYLEAVEYQYITLCEGDKIESITLEDTSTTAKINNNWQNVIDCLYTLNDADTASALPMMSNEKWQVRSKLYISISSNAAQTLSQSADQTEAGSFKESLVFVDATGTPTGTIIKPEDDSISIKTNTITISNGDPIYIPEEYSGEFKIKTFNLDELDGAVNFDGFGNNTTKINIDDLTNVEEVGSGIRHYLDLYITLPGNINYTALMTTFCVSEPSLIDNVLNTNGTYFTLLTTDEENTPVTDGTKLAIYNYKDSNNSDIWWSNHTYVDPSTLETRYYLKTNQDIGGGLNIVEIIPGSSANTNKIYKLRLYGPLQEPSNNISSPNNDEPLYKRSETTIIIEDLDIIKGINQKLAMSTSLLINSLLNKLAELDPEHNFYYNNKGDKSVLIDFNQNLNAEQEDITDPKFWYDYNNINNNFVISEIDGQYLKTGITLTKSSKL